jgi:LPS-assembly protein
VSFLPARLALLGSSERFLAVLCLTATSMITSVSVQADTPALNWYPRALLSDAEQADLPSFCSGRYLPNTLQPVPDGRLEAESEQAFVDRLGNAEFTGDVIMQREDYVLKSRSAYWDADLRQAEFEGDVSFLNNEVTVHSDSARFRERLNDTATSPDSTDSTDSTNSSELVLQNARYALPARHMRGTATRMITRSEGTIELNEATVTWCEPGQNDWRIAASNIYLDQERGVGSAWNTRLEVMDVPVFYIPYYRFPIDDRRTTGFLDPSFSLGGDAGLDELKMPFYLNLASNLDATITPHYFNQRGWLWESQLRHKTGLFGDGELNYAYIDQDATEDSERWLINYQQSGRFGQHWQHRWIYNHVSDDDYLSDLNSSATIDRTTHLPRMGLLSYQKDAWQLDLLVEGFQTIDDSIDLEDRPYKRLPQATLDYRQQYDRWQVSSRLQATRFERDNSAVIDGTEQTLTDFDSLNGRRLVSDNTIAWRFEQPYSYLQPEASYRYRYYRLSSQDSFDYDDTINYGVPRYSLDSGLFFERSLHWFNEHQTQTLEPRLFWVKSPYQSGQDDIPAFDTKVTSVTYDSLFVGDRFIGSDRLADLEQVSLGITSRIIDQRGDEWLRFSLGRVYFGDERQVLLDSDEVNDSNNTSSTIAEVEWRPGDHWRLNQTLEWDAYGDYARQHRFGAGYTPGNNRMLNLSVNKVQSEDSDSGDIETDLYQADVSAYWALNDSWALTGRVLKDMKDYPADERRPVSSVLEALAGFEYQNCCWRLQVLYKEYSPTADDDSSYSTEKTESLMFSIQLKGLSTLGGGTDATISNSIKGYSKRQYHDY